MSVVYGTSRGNGLLAAVILGSAVAFLDSTVVNVALPVIGRDLDASFTELQWVVTGYSLTLAAFILVGGSLGDRFGRRRVFQIGVVWFALSPLVCAVAPNPAVLIAARVLQGVGGALLTPGSLAMIQGAFVPEDRAPAIGAWSGLGSIASAIGPFVGGALIEYASWRWVLFVNVPIGAVLIVGAYLYLHESERHSGRFDALGGVLSIAGMVGVVYGFIHAANDGWSNGTTGAVASSKRAA